MSYQYLLSEQTDGVATITLNRPEKHNALSQELLAELRDVLDAILHENEEAEALLETEPS
jgi:enoyl-CoA hydratase/carnithine racemase